MLNTSNDIEHQLMSEDAISAPDKADMFVNGEYTIGDDESYQIVLSLLEELGILKDPQIYVPHDGRKPTARKRQVDHLRKLVCFTASFLRVAACAKHFSIPMDRHYWIGKPCGYKAAREIKDALLEKGVIHVLTEAKQGKRATIYGYSAAFAMRLDVWKPELCFKRVRNDCVEVRSRPVRHAGRKVKGKSISLKNFDAHEVQQQLKSILWVNERLANHTLSDTRGKRVDTTLRRIFSEDLTNGGRMYGDYQNYPEAERLSWTIGNEAVCEIDLKGSHLNILAAMFKHPARLPQDPYAEISWVDSPQYRKAAKMLVMCSIASQDGNLTRMPKGEKGISFRDKHGLPAEWKATDLIAQIFEIYPFLKGMPDMTLALQYLESEIIREALLSLIELGIPAYPIHDSLLVRLSDRDQVLQVLQGTLSEHLGTYAPWLDISMTGRPPELVSPLPCDTTDDSYRLSSWLKDNGRSPKAPNAELPCLEGITSGESKENGLVPNQHHRTAPPPPHTDRRV